jgi:hypothetical protein
VDPARHGIGALRGKPLLELPLSILAKLSDAFESPAEKLFVRLIDRSFPV